MADPDKNKWRRKGSSSRKRTGPVSPERPRPTSRHTGRKPGPARGKPRQSNTNNQGPARSVPKGQLPDDVIYGINPVSVAIETGQLKVMYFDKSRLNERIQQLHALAAGQNIECQPLARQGWSKILSSELHQGVAGMLHTPQRHFLEEIIHDVGPDSCILALDRIQDPQNLGAVLRTAAACGVDAVVLPKSGGCGITPAVHKASAGMSLVVRIVEDENLARAIEFLKDHDYWVVGCDSGEGEDATLFEFPARRVLVMGNEAEGMRRLTRESCDYLVRIPMKSSVESLNVSVATAVVMYLAKADLARAAQEEQHHHNNGQEGVDNS